MKTKLIRRKVVTSPMLFSVRESDRLKLQALFNVTHQRGINRILAEPVVLENPRLQAEIMSLRS